MMWKCKLCGSIVRSNPHTRHTMDSCKCGKISVDLEENYMRVLGEIYDLVILKPRSRRRRKGCGRR